MYNDGTATVTAGVLANNTATTAAADAYSTASGTLSISGANSSTTFTADSKGLLIDGWYEDTSSARYYTAATDDAAASYNITRVAMNSATASNASSEVFWIAAHAQYTVTYDANETSVDQTDGSATGTTTDAGVYTENDTVRVASNGFSLTGYTFTGWNTAANGTGASYAAGNTFTMTADLAGDDNKVVLYAQWEPISYTVAFDANAEDASGTMDKQSMTYDVAASLSANQFVRTGYTFAGWNTASDGNGTSYKDGEEVKNLTTTDGGEITLYAQWTEDTYTVTYTDGVDGEDVFEDTVYTITYTQKTAGEIPGFDPDGDGEDNTPERDGYTFAGWDETEDEDGNLTYTATWTEVVEETPEEETTDETTEEELAQTGDSTAFTVLCIAATGVVALIAGIVVSRRRRA